jgi:hypothetical protein
VSLLYHLLLASGDFLLITLINLCLVPFNHTLGGDAVNLSFLDGGFAVGSLLFSLIAPAAVARLGPIRAAATGLLGQAAAFGALALAPAVGDAVGAMIWLGAANTLSLTTFMGHLQARAQGPVKGRVSAVRQLWVTVLSCLLVPLWGVVVAQDGVRLALWLTAAVAVLYAAALGALAGWRHQGSALLMTPVDGAALGGGPSWT